MNNEANLNAEKLDGYLSGIASLSGKIREYQAFAFIIKKKESGETLETSLFDKYAPHTKLNCFDVESLDSGLASFESGIQDHLLEDILESGDYFSDSNILNDRKRYLAFRVMDMISPLIEGQKDIMPYRVQGEFSHTEASCTFYCISFGEHILVIQFVKEK